MIYNSKGKSVRVALCAAQEHGSQNMQRFLGELFSGFMYLFSGFVFGICLFVCFLMSCLCEV